MIIVSLTYVMPIEAVEAHLEAHMEWLKEGYESGVLIASGRKVPRTGGVLLARGDLDAVKAFCARDPFAVHGVATYDFTEAAISITASGLEGLKD
ncbi:YciI family protein [Rhizobium sp. PAMB 3182]